MKLNDLVVNSVLVNEVSGEIVGYMLMNNVGQCVALTKSKITELDSDLATYIDYLDLPIICVLSARNYYALLENSLYKLEDYEDDDYVKLDDKVCIYGFVFNFYHLVELDNETAINNVLTSSEDY